MKQKKLLAAILMNAVIVSGFVLPLHFWERTGITALAEESSGNEGIVLDKEALGWQDDASDVPLADTEDWELPSGYIIETEHTSYADDLLATASNSCGANLTWSLSGGTLTVSGTGEMDDYYIDSSSAPWTGSKNQIISVIIGSGVTKIGARAFADCVNMTKVVLPDTLTDIREGAFYGCSALKNITLPSGVQEISSGLFAGCSALTEVSAPGAVSIKSYAFQNTKIENFTLGKSLTNIHMFAFYKAWIGAFSVEAGNSVFSAVDGILFSDNGQTLFAYPSGKTEASYTIPATVKKVGGILLGNENVTQIIIPESVTEFGEYAFSEYSALTSITIPDSVMSAEVGTFYECTRLKSVQFGKGLKSTSYAMFEGCRLLEEVDFGNALEELEAHTFGYCKFLEEVELPANIKKIGNGAFGECTYMKSFTSHGLTYIPFQAFLNDRSLVNVNLNEGVTDIYRYAFGGCPRLLEVTLPASMNFVDAHAFDPDVKLTVKNDRLGAYGTNGLRTLEYFTIPCSYNYSKAFEVLDIVNQRRREAGLPDLVMNASLLETAMQRAAEVAVLFSHTRPDGSSCFDLNTLMRGENIAYGNTTSESVMTSWMNSEGHRKNILTGTFTTIGIGCVVVDGRYYWIQCFGDGEDDSSCSCPSDGTGSQQIQIATETFDEASTTSDVIWGEPESYTYTGSLSMDASTVSLGKQYNAVYYLKNPVLGTEIRINTEELVWSSSDISVATVSDGVVTVLAGGTAEIAATMANGSYKAGAVINVAVSPSDQIRSFVSRMYTVALGRDAEEAGSFHRYLGSLQRGMGAIRYCPYHKPYKRKRLFPANRFRQRLVRSKLR